MTSEWKEFLLGEILEDYIRGPFGSSLKRGEMQEEGIPIYEQQNAIYDHRKFRYYINDEKFEAMKRFKVQEHDLIISCSGTIGKVSIIKENDPVGIISQALLILRPNTSLVIPEFLFYYFSSHYGYYDLTSVSSGSVQVNVANRKIIEKTKIRLPPISKQIVIVNKFSSIDGMLSNQKNSLNTTEQLISAFFRSWFIDFDPVKAKSEGKLPYGMDEETAAMFPDSFEDSELGPIPTGWRIEYLADLCDIQRGFSYTGASLCEQGEGIAMINLASFVEGGGYNHIGLKYILSEYNEKFSIKRGDVFIATVDLTPGLRVVGSPLIAPSSLENESIFSQDLLRLRIKTDKKIGCGFLFHWLKIRRGILKQWSSGTTVSRFPISALNRYPVLIPPREILQRFENIFDHAQKFFDLSQTKMTYLSLTRDSLLPRLMSGELEV